MNTAKAAPEARGGTRQSRPSRIWVTADQIVPGRYLPSWPR